MRFGFKRPALDLYPHRFLDNAMDLDATPSLQYSIEVKPIHKYVLENHLRAHQSGYIIGRGRPKRQGARGSCALPDDPSSSS